VIAYAVLRRREGAEQAHPEQTVPAMLASIAVCVAVVAALAVLAAMAGMTGCRHIKAAITRCWSSKGVSPTLLALSLVGLIALWRLPRTTVLDSLADGRDVACGFCDVRVVGGIRVGAIRPRLVRRPDLWVACGELRAGHSAAGDQRLHGRLAAAKAQIADRARDPRGGGCANAPLS